MRWVFVKGIWPIAVTSMAVACAASAPTPQSAEPGSEDGSPSPAAVESGASDEAVGDEAVVGEPVVDEPVGEVPVVEGQWRPSLPTVSLETLDEDEVRRGSACFETHGVTELETGAEGLMAGAACLRDARSYGKEIAVHRMIIARFPEDPLAAEAMRTMGLRFEQMSNWSSALDTYETYVEMYPKREDARALGLRAVCVARVLGDGRREEEMLGDLKRLYGRKGFVRPKAEQVAGLCGETDGE